MAFLYYLWVFSFYSDDVSFLQATKIRVLPYAHFIHVLFPCSTEHFQNRGSVELCKAQLPTVSSVVFTARKLLKPNRSLWIALSEFYQSKSVFYFHCLITVFLHQLFTFACFCCAVQNIPSTENQESFSRSCVCAKEAPEKLRDPHFILLVLNKL